MKKLFMLTAFVICLASLNAGILSAFTSNTPSGQVYILQSGAECSPIPCTTILPAPLPYIGNNPGQGTNILGTYFLCVGGQGNVNFCATYSTTPPSSNCFTPTNPPSTTTCAGTFYTTTPDPTQFVNGWEDSGIPCNSPTYAQCTN